MKKIIFLGALSLVFLSGCEAVDGYALGGSYPATYTPAPPAHAPAYGYRRQHRYYYYPEAEFYFDIDRNMYFFLNSAGRWEFSVNLPLHLRPHLRHRYVEIEMDVDRPYLRHKIYRRKYGRHYFRDRPHDKRYRERHNRHDDREYTAPGRHGMGDRMRHKYKDRRERVEDRLEERREKRHQRFENRRNKKYDEDENGHGKKRGWKKRHDDE